MRLTRREQAAHTKVMALVERGDLTPHERDVVMTDYREDAEHLNGMAGPSSPRQDSP